MSHMSSNSWDTSIASMSQMSSTIDSSVGSKMISPSSSYSWLIYRYNSTIGMGNKGTGTSKGTNIARVSNMASNSRDTSIAIDASMSHMGSNSWESSVASMGHMSSNSWYNTIGSS